MTINAQTPRFVAAGNGTRGPFTLSVSGTAITYADSSELVFKRYDDDNALVGTLVDGVDFSITADSVETGDAAATFTLDSTEDVLATGESIIVERITPKTSDFALASTGGIFAAAIDKITRILQEVYVGLTRRVEFDPTYTGTTTIPPPAAGYFLGWNALGTALVNLAAIAEETVSSVLTAFITSPTLAGAQIALGVREVLTANRSYYVNHATGSDSNTGLSSGAAFATFAKAYSVARDDLDFNGYRVTINVAAGTITERFELNGGCTGQKDIDDLWILGDASTPANCTISTTLSCIRAYNGARALIQGFRVTASGGQGIQSYEGAWLHVGNIIYHTCGSTHNHTADGDILVVAACTITGGATHHVVSEIGNGGFDFGANTITLSGTPAFTGSATASFVNCGEGSYVAIHDAVFLGSATGVRYLITDEGALCPPSKRDGLPGSIAGVVAQTQIVHPAGRLTLTTAVAVTVSDVTAATTLYYTPHAGNMIPYASSPSVSSVLTSRSFTELSLALDSDSGHTGYHQSGKNFDVFVYNNTSTAGPSLVLGTGPAWTNDTARAGAISLNSGIYANTSSMVLRFGSGAGNTLTAEAGTAVYVGTIRASANGQTEDSLANRFVWNAHNRRPRAMRVTDGADTWTYTTATVRQARAAATNQLSMVRGLDQDEVFASVIATVSNSTAGVDVATGIGVDTTTQRSTGGIGGFGDIMIVDYRQCMHSEWRGFPGLGYHYLAWLEYSEATGTTTWYGDGGVPNVLQSGIHGTVHA